MKHGQSIFVVCNVAGFKENARKGILCNNADVSSLEPVRANKMVRSSNDKSDQSELA